MAKRNPVTMWIRGRIDKALDKDINANAREIAMRIVYEMKDQGRKNLEIAFVKLLTKEVNYLRRVKVRVREEFATIERDWAARRIVEAKEEPKRLTWEEEQANTELRRSQAREKREQWVKEHPGWLYDRWGRDPFDGFRVNRNHPAKPGTYSFPIDSGPPRAMRFTIDSLKAWLDAEDGKKWLATPAGKAWRGTPAFAQLQTDYEENRPFKKMEKIMDDFAINRALDILDGMFLGMEFALGNGERVKWGEATRDQHEETIRLLLAQADGTVETASRHQIAIRMLDENQVENLNAVREKLLEGANANR